MPSAMCAIATSDMAYLSELHSKGFWTTDTVTYGGKTYTHDDIAATFDEAYQRHRPEFAVLCGGKPRLERKRERKFERAVKSDAYTSFGISWTTIVFGAILTLLGGPMGLVIAVVSALFQVYLKKDVSEDQAMMIAMGVA